MYGITLSSAECPVFYTTGDMKTYTFSLAETKVLINNLLDKKARGNGVGRHLFDTLRLNGSCRYDFSRNTGPLAFYCKAFENGYAVVLLGTYPYELIGRLNQFNQQSRAVSVTRSLCARRRQLRKTGHYRPVKPKTPRSLVGANANLKLHFRNSVITCADAIAVIAYAAKLDQHWVRNRLIRSLDERAVASLRLKGGFVFRIDLPRWLRAFLDLSTHVQIRTTNDNTHGAYRRLRNALRKHLKRERKERVAAEKKYLAAKRLQKTASRLLA